MPSSNSQEGDAVLLQLGDEITAAASDSLRMNARLELASYFLNKDLDRFWVETQQVEDDLNRVMSYDRSFHKVRMLQQRGIAARKGSKFKEAIQLYMLSIEEIEKAKAYIDPLPSYFYIGVVFYELENYEDAIRYYKKGIALRKDSQEDVFLGDAYNNIGLTYRKKKALDSALFYYEKAQVVYDNMGDEKGIAKLRNNMGSIYTKKKEYARAIAMKMQSLAYYKRTTLYASQAIIHYSIGTNYGKLEQYDKAITHLDTVITLSRKHNYQQQLKKAYKRRAQLYLNQGNYKQAFVNQEAYNQLIDSLSNVERNEEIELLIRANEAEKNELKTRAQLEAQQARNFQNYIIIAAVLLLLLMGFLYYRKQAAYTKLKNKHLKNTVASQEQAIQNKEGVITELMQDSLAQLRKKDRLISKMESIAQSESTSIDVEEMLRSLKAEKFDEKKLLLFHEKLYQNHPQLKMQLKQLHPDFTDGEVDMAHYVLLELSLKEIANLKGVSVDSVKKSRYRLKKKIGLPKGESLYKYFTNL